MEQTRLLIMRPGAIGDTLLAFPTIQVLRAQYPDPHVTFVGHPTLLPLVRACALAEEVSNYGEAQWSELFLTPTRIAARGGSRLHDLLQNMDRALCWLHDPDGIVTQNLRAASIKHVIVASGRPPAGEQIHEAQYLAKTAGVQIDLDRPPLISLPPPAADMLPNCIAIHPGSGGPRKCWPVSHFAAIITALWRRHVPVLLLGGPADYDRLEELRQHLGAPPQAELLTMLIDAPLLDVARQLQACRGYLGNDAGITHLAAMLGVPTIALFGPTSPAVWRPLGPSVTVLHEPELDHLHTDVVMDTIEATFDLKRA
jgi:heptosyltransferase-3